MTDIQNRVQMELTRKRLLFVDDEHGIRETLPVIMRRYGFIVTVAATLAEGIQQIQDQQFDLLLCDLNIERYGDGYDVIRAMRKVNPDCVIMILTAYPDFESAVDAIRLRIDDYLTKPYDADLLVALMAANWPNRHPRAGFYGGHEFWNWCRQTAHQ